jgi:peroxiredoxin
VVLLRFWSDECPYCARTLPVLEGLWKRNRERGLVVVGVYHPKDQAGRDAAVPRKVARALGLDFPVGTDRDWQTLHAYGVGTTFQRFTSVSFLVDRAGVIRWVHDGGEYHPSREADHADCDAAYRALEAALDEALGPTPTGAAPPRRGRAARAAPPARATTSAPR